IEYDRSFAVQQNPVLNVPAHRARKHNLLQIAPFLYEIVHGVAMGNSDNVLLNDWPIVEHLRHVVARSANQLDAAHKCLMIRLRSHKGWKERVMDINHATGILGDELIGKN